MESKTTFRNLLFLFFGALVVRVAALAAYFQYNPCMLLYDAGHYHALALSLIRGFGYVGKDGKAYFYRLPGYPFFLSGCYKIFGESPIPALFVQTVLGSLIPIFIFFITRLFFEKNQMIAYLAALISCFHTGYIIYAGLVMSEILFSIIFMLFCLIFFYALKVRKNNRLQALFFGLSGMVLGVASVIRPVGFFVILLSLTYPLFFLHGSKIKKIFSSTILFFGWVAVVGIWLLRNFLITGYLFFHTLSGPHFINHVAVRLEMANSHSSYSQARDNVYCKVDQEVQKMSIEKKQQILEIEECLAMEKVAIQFMRKNYFTTLKLFCENIAKTAFGLYSSELLVIENAGALPKYATKTSWIEKAKKFLMPFGVSRFICWWMWYEIALWLIILFGCFGFFVTSLYDQKGMMIVLQLAPFIGLFLVISLACGFARFRLPIEHFLIMLASKFWIDLYRK